MLIGKRFGDDGAKVIELDCIETITKDIDKKFSIHAKSGMLHPVELASATERDQVFVALHGLWRNDSARHTY